MTAMTSAPPSGYSLIKRTFYASGTSGTHAYDARTKMRLVKLQAGGGGGANATATANQTNVGGGGGGGEYVEDWSAPGNGAYAVGGGGAAQTAGGDTTFESLTAHGGAGCTLATGSGTTLARSSGGAVGGTGGAGNVANIPGQTTGPALRYSGTEAISGAGGNSHMGYGGYPVTNSNGTNGRGYGGGGAGSADAAATARTGGLGSGGGLWIEEYGKP